MTKTYLVKCNVWRYVALPWCSDIMYKDVREIVVKQNPYANKYSVMDLVYKELEKESSYFSYKVEILEMKTINE